VEKSGLTYIVTSSVSVYVTSGTAPVLTIEPGVTVKFNQSAGLSIGWSSSSYPGALSAVERHLHRSCSRRARRAPAPGDWNGIDFGNGTLDGSTVLDYVTVEYAGGNGKPVPVQRQSLHEKLHDPEKFQLCINLYSSSPLIQKLHHHGKCNVRYLR